MAPLNPFSSVEAPTKRGRRIGKMEQAGRSELSLMAERGNGELRPKALLSSLPTCTSSSHDTPSDTSEVAWQEPIFNSYRRLYAPMVPSPLCYSSSSLSSTEEQNRISGNDGKLLSSGNSANGQGLGSTVAAGTRTRNSRYSTSISQVLLREGSKAALQAPEILKPDSPRRLGDLGRDYSRYPPSRAKIYSTSISQTQRSSLSGPERNKAVLEPEQVTRPKASLANLERLNYPDDRIGVMGPYFAEEKGSIWYNDEIEADDEFHAPDENDGIERLTFKEYFAKRTIVSTCGAMFLLLGLLCIFIVLPILTFVTRIYLPSINGGSETTSTNYGPSWAHVNNNTYPLLSNIRKGLVDPDTPDHAITRKSTFGGPAMNLVFSDEFNDDNRTFYPGDDPYWTAPSLWYGATQDLEWYDPDAVTTRGGTLQLRLDASPNHNLQYRSGMLNSWNQLCFKGGVFEVSVSLAGPAGVPGLWPGVWSMGNLGRPGYKATTEGVWPYTYDSCDVGITPNQSDPDGLSFLPGQKLSSCTCKGEDHPSPGIGRGAPEIDVLEGSIDPQNLIGVVTQSFQVAPFDVYYRPNSNFMQIQDYQATQMNTYCGGPFQQAVSATTLLNNEWYNGTAYQKYAFEYVPGSPGKIAWFVGEDESFMMDSRAIGPNGNVAQRQVSEEPMSLVLNLGISGSWSQISFGQLTFPTTMHIDYVRIYQQPGQKSVTCDPPGYPTTEYIQNHLDAYTNPNLTVSHFLSHS